MTHFMTSGTPHQRFCRDTKKHVSKCNVFYHLIISFLNYRHAIEAEMN
jgi:hypothetical protein